MSLFEETSTGLKSKFSALIRLNVKKLNLTQAQVAKILGTDQPRVSNLLSGNLKGFSIDFMIKALEKLGYVFQIDYDPTDEEAPVLIAVRKQSS